MIKCICFLFIIFFQTFLCSAQTVINAVSRQEQSNVIVSYNLETTSPSKISLYVSLNGGRSWEGPLKKVKGDIGDNISSGEHSIIWSVLDEYNELRGDNIKFQVRVDNDEFIKIGKQVWATKNLDVITYRNGDPIPHVQDNSEWAKLTTGAWCFYENKTENGIIYGKLYNWYAVKDRRGLAPAGYHIPSEEEWQILINFLGDESSQKMKSTIGWNNGGNGRNTSGFTGLPGGLRYYDGSFGTVGDKGYWWSSTDYNTSDARDCLLYYFGDYASTNYYDKKVGFSIRCIRN